MYEQLFLMSVIPSMMVQSYICYVTTPTVEVEFSKFKDISSCKQMFVEGNRKVTRERSNSLIVQSSF